MSTEPITVGYWSIRGLGAPCRMMAMYAGQPFHARCHDVRSNGDKSGWDLSDWSEDKAELKKRNPFINLPYVIDGDRVVTQTNAVLTYLAHKFNMLPRKYDASTHEMMLCEIMDLRNKMTEHAYGRDQKDGSKEAAEALIKSQCTSSRGSLQKLSAWLDTDTPDVVTTGQFLLGDSATAPDFHLFELLDQFDRLAQFHGIASPMDMLAPLKIFYEAWLKDPKLKPYLDSALHRLPMNQKMATFGATPDGSRFTPGQKYDWDLGTVSFNLDKKGPVAAASSSSPLGGGSSTGPMLLLAGFVLGCASAVVLGSPNSPFASRR